MRIEKPPFGNLHGVSVRPFNGLHRFDKCEKLLLHRSIWLRRFNPLQADFGAPIGWCANCVSVRSLGRGSEFLIRNKVIV